jgi:hypothetical protein
MQCAGWHDISVAKMGICQKPEGNKKEIKNTNRKKYTKRRNKMNKIKRRKNNSESYQQSLNTEGSNCLPRSAGKLVR